MSKINLVFFVKNLNR
uniref:Uncharacterized protein n=1 Tax=Arundo donax TaxID=35708 RepID=A0A0A8YCS3_ARUDO